MKDGHVKRRWLAPEVVQTSSMDCGPAALKCLLQGFDIDASYGRLREACQTGVDGTSIDMLEEVAGKLGLAAEQMIIPADHILLDKANILPVIVVVTKAEDTSLHFVVVWQRIGKWLQIMDPANGRRWVKADQFLANVFAHSMNVEPEMWQEWAITAPFQDALRARMIALGLQDVTVTPILDVATADPEWRALAALDAAIRMTTTFVAVGAVKRGDEAAALIEALAAKALGERSAIPPRYWSVEPDPDSDPDAMAVKIKGAVLLSIAGKRETVLADDDGVPIPLEPELAAALAEKPDAPLKTLWKMMSEDGLRAPLIMALAMVIAVFALILEALLFRGIFDIAKALPLQSQRLMAGVSLLIFLMILLTMNVALGIGVRQLGRRLEIRFRLALLKKIPLLNDRYFQSRPITDMADRSHQIHFVRSVPETGLDFVQSFFDLCLTFVGLLIIAPGSLWWALALIICGVGIPFLVQTFLNERDLRVRTQGGALHGFYLDALLGLSPIRAHRAERSVHNQHEGLLVEWAKSLKGWIQLSLLSGTFQSALCTGLAVALLMSHFAVQGTIIGPDLLLIFWTLKLPSVAASLALLAHQYPAQRNVLLRILEPLSAPEEIAPAKLASTRTPSVPKGMAIEICQGAVVAGGHDILRGVNLKIEPGEHIAIVGISGAGKSSLLGLLLGWHRLASGDILVDGEPLDARTIDGVRQSTAWIDPAIQVWNQSLLENITYAVRDDQLSGVGAVIKAAKLRTVAEKLPDGLQNFLGEGGGILSGGEGQRVRLARALLAHDTRLALLDEPFRGLDRTQRHALLQDVRAWWPDATLLCVTHDVAETLSFDRVLVIEDGVILEDGIPKILAQQPSRYGALLQAEQHVETVIWNSAIWRKITLDLHGGASGGMG